jgi:homopolymeric O-antigen transport system permease protein
MPVDSWPEISGGGCGIVATGRAGSTALQPAKSMQPHAKLERASPQCTRGFADTVPTLRGAPPEDDRAATVGFAATRAAAESRARADMDAPVRSRLQAAGRDIIEGVKQHRLWSTLAWLDIRQRYRRSAIGPFWITISIGLMVLGLGLLYAGLFGQRKDVYVPYLAAGLITWSLMSAVIIDSCGTFIASEGSIKQIRAPLSIYAYRVVWRNLLVFAHYAGIMVLVVIAYGVPVGVGTLLVVPGLLLLVLNSLWVAVLLGLLCARFRDIPQLIASLVQAIFFLTPILWSAEQLESHRELAAFNPIYHLITIVRAPMLGETPTAANWIVALAVTGAGLAVAFLLFARYRGRIAYWV